MFGRDCFFLYISSTVGSPYISVARSSDWFLPWVLKYGCPFWYITLVFSGIVPEQWVVCGFVGFCGSGYGDFVGYFYLFGLVFGELEGVAPAVPSVWGVVGVPEGAVYGQDDIVKGIVFCPYAVAAGSGVLR